MVGGLKPQPLIMLIQRGAREDAIHALINTWLNDKTQHCGWCGARFDPAEYPCCEKPFIANNKIIFAQFYRELQEDRDMTNNKFASTKGNNMRWTLKFPPGLLSFLEQSFYRLYDEPLFTKEYDINWFARKFYKYFSVPKEI